MDDLKEELPRILQRNTGPIFFNPNINPRINQFLQGMLSKQKILNVNTILASMRLIKSEAEIELMRKAGDVAAFSMVETMKATKPNMSEHELGAKMEYECKKMGAQRLSYPAVVAGGQNALTLHYITNDMILKDGDLVLMDAGAEYHGYSSDITRCWPVNGKFTEGQLELYNLVLHVNKECIKLCQRGNSLLSIHRSACSLFDEGLSKLGIHGLSHDYFPHSIGHWLGMDVHDVGEISSSTTLESGMIITIEPGLYIPNKSDIPTKYRGIGIRVEDDVVVREGEPEVLTKNVPKDPQVIERIING